MIIIRAPLRISFVGGGTDIASFYDKDPGQVLSATIDKYVYLSINSTPHIDKVGAKYSITELVDSPKDLEHKRIREALIDLDIKNNIEIGSFADIPSGTGLGSSSAFSVALMRGLHTYKGIKIGREETAQQASKLEIDLCKEPIGKQDQYASAYGGFNIFRFKKGGNVETEPIFIDYKKKTDLENSILLFYTGINRSASEVLSAQKDNMKNKHEILKEMAAQVPIFKDKLLKGDIEGMGKMMHDYWQKKKDSHSSNNIIDDLYDTGLRAGAWGGKLLGAGDGGCIMFIADLKKHNLISEAVLLKAQDLSMEGFKQIPVSFVQSGVEVVFNSKGK
jgi:D-glycero-alpha-D-manno-heptose-7-phosphate kinase